MNASVLVPVIAFLVIGCAFGAYAYELKFNDYYDFEVVSESQDGNVIQVWVATTNLDPYNSFSVIDKDGNVHTTKYNNGLWQGTYGWAHHTVIASTLLFDLPAGAVFDHVEYTAGDGAEHVSLPRGEQVF